MSRIGKNKILIPEEVQVSQDNGVITVNGKLGKLTQEIHSSIAVQISEDNILLTRVSEEKQVKSLHGLYAALLLNMIEGVSKGFTKKLEFIGVGYRASVQGNLLDISAGYSHNIVFEIPLEIKIKADAEKGKAPIVTLFSHDKQLLGAVAAKIRSFRKPEPYKGKGIRYIDEYVRRKAGKTAAAAS